MRPDGRGARLVSYAAGCCQTSLASSPRDGTLLLAGPGRLLAVDPRGGSAVDLLGNPKDALLAPGWPTWSPDGRLVAFRDGGFTGDVYVIDAASRQRKVYPGPLRARWLVWSPDSSMLAVEDPNAPGSHYGNLRLIAVEEGGLVERGRVDLPHVPLLLEWR